METELDIIIVNYNTAGQVIDCVEAIAQAVGEHRCNIIVVDNCSQNDPDMERLSARTDCTLIRLDGNYGFGYANNRGVEASSSPLVMFLNPDTIPLPNSIGTMIEYMDRNEDVGALGCNLIDANDKPTHSFRRVEDGFFMELNFALGGLPMRLLYGKNAQYNYTAEPMECAYICGADLMTRRNIINKIGAFDELFFMYYEDQDLCMRIKKEGHKVVNIPNAQIKHLEGQSFTLHERREKMIQESRVKFYRKHKSMFSLHIANAMNIIFLSAGVIVNRLRGNKNIVDKYRFRRGVMIGQYR